MTTGLKYHTHAHTGTLMCMRPCPPIHVKESSPGRSWNEERVKNPIEFYYMLDGYKETHKGQRFTNRSTDSVTELMRRRFSKLSRVLNVTEEISTGQKSMKGRDPGACTGQNWNVQRWMCSHLPHTTNHNLPQVNIQTKKTKLTQQSQISAHK